MSDSPDEPDREPSLGSPGIGAWSAERVLFLFALALVTAGIGAALFVASNRDDPDDASGLSDADSSTADAAVGPDFGVEVEPYLAERRAALDAADGERVAIISFGDYVGEDVADERLADVEVGVLFVAFPGAESTATSDLETLREELTAEAESQLPELRSILPTIENDPEFAAFYAAEIERYEQVLASGTHPEVVFGAIVRADADTLRELASTAGVRLVDVAETPVVRKGAALRGIRPEETTTVGDPPVRPIPEP